MTLSGYDFSKLSAADRAEVLAFAEFLSAVGRAPGGPDRTPEDVAKLKAWVQAEPEQRCAYLGLTLERARKLGVAV